MTAVLEDLRSLADEDLADVYRAGDDAAARAVLGEAERRDLADRTRAAREALAVIRHEAECAVHAQFLAASDWCRGRLLSREGMAADVTDQDLWRLPEERVLRFASEELRDFWLYVQPRITSGVYVRQRAAQMRIARAEALEGAGPKTSKTPMRRRSPMSTTSTTPEGRNWLEMGPQHFDSSLLPRKHRKPDPDALFTVPDLAPSTAKTARTPAPPQLEGQGDLFDL